MSVPTFLFQFKITLQEIQPAIWRRIQVPAKQSFWDRHVAIQDAMGWKECHFHAFRLKQKHRHACIEIGIPDEEDENDPCQAGWREWLADYFHEPGQRMEYLYDFGDYWVHEVLLEGLLLKEKGVRYPRCLDGQRACPPEDCGSIPGYEQLVAILQDPRHEEYQAMVEWLGDEYGEYDPERFDPAKVKFDNPQHRFNKAFAS